MIILVETTPTFRLCFDPNPRLGFYLLGFPKPVRFEPKHYTRTIPLRFPRSKRESIGGTPIGRAFPAKTATEEPHQDALEESTGLLNHTSNQNLHKMGFIKVGNGWATARAVVGG